jgi:hypothetical protein
VSRDPDWCVHPLAWAPLPASREGKRRCATGRRAYYLRRRAPMRRSVARSLFSPSFLLPLLSTTAADYSFVDSSSSSRPQQCTRARNIARRKAKVDFFWIRLLFSWSGLCSLAWARARAAATHIFLFSYSSGESQSGSSRLGLRPFPLFISAGKAGA